MADILNTEENYNPKLGLKNIYAKLIEIIAKVNTLWASLVAQPKVYKALLTQTGTDAPVATVLVNTLSGTPVWSYDDVGSFLLTLAGEFPDETKVSILGSPLGGTTLSNASSIVTWNDTDSIHFEVFKNGVAANSIYLNYTILIEVYP